MLYIYHGNINFLYGYTPSRCKKTHFEKLLDGMQDW